MTQDDEAPSNNLSSAVSHRNGFAEHACALQCFHVETVRLQLQETKNQKRRPQHNWNFTITRNILIQVVKKMKPFSSLSAGECSDEP
jgi:hypothetical protein